VPRWISPARSREVVQALLPVSYILHPPQVRTHAPVHSSTRRLTSPVRRNGFALTLTPPSGYNRLRVAHREGVRFMTDPPGIPRNWDGCRVAITGATGFVGSHVAAELARRGAAVLAVHRPGSDISRLLAGGIRCTIAALTDP